MSIEQQAFFAAALIDKDIVMSVIVADSSESAYELFNKKHQVYPETIISKEQLLYMVDCCTFAESTQENGLPDIEIIRQPPTDWS